MKVSTVQQMHSLDRRAIEQYKIPGYILMENAGEAAYYVILDEFGVKGRKFVVFCGSGHNGGDGLVVARKINSTGGQVVVLCLSSPQKFDDTVRFHYEMVEKAGIPFVLLNDENVEEVSRKYVSEADAIVDAIFGTGISREVRGRYRKAIEIMNESGKTVFSIDIPSGVHGDTGQVMGVAVRADYTITYGLPKTGTMLFPGFELCGKLYVTHISFPPENYNDPAIRTELTRLLPLPERPMDSHKGAFGKVMFVSGSARYMGAPYFSAMSFLKAGGGLSYLATPKSAAPFIANKGSEIVFMPQKETPSGSLALENFDELLALSRGMDMVVLGPGISLDEEPQELARRLSESLDKPLLIDGDGLTAIAEHPEIVSRRTAPTVLTPHPGEMARLMGITVSDVQADRIGVLREATKKWNSYIVLKGSHSLIGHPDGTVYINLSGNSGMATAGSGDVLTGTIAAMYAAAKFDFPDAVRMGVFIHGFAGDMAAVSIGEDGMVAGDILAFLPEAIDAYRENYEDIVENFYYSLWVI